jgi:iron-sulfur cluster repair di-iron protein
MSNIESLFIPDLKPALKHPTVLKKFDDLKSGDTLLLINDHDPIPLYYEMKAEKGEIFEWKKIENGPEVWKVEIKKTGSSFANIKTVENKKEAAKDQLPVLDITVIEPRLKHPTIFKHFDALKEGEAFLLLNDHDPKPLYYQLIGERGNVFTWSYLENGPRWWKIQIKKNDPQSGDTVGELVARDSRKAEVFKKYGIDFCCGGKKSLKEVCAEKGLDISIVEAELENPIQKTTSQNHYNRWELDFLADYIYNQHHLYYYDEVPLIKDLLTKVMSKHGDSHPEIRNLFTLFVHLTEELNTHFIREERVLFPFIKALVAAKRTRNFGPLNNQPALTEPIQMMESDHAETGELLMEIKKMAGGYNPPTDACNSYRLLYKKLNELDEDLHQHIHLENNILFAKALKVDKEIRG